MTVILRAMSSSCAASGPMNGLPLNSIGMPVLLTGPVPRFEHQRVMPAVLRWRLVVTRFFGGVAIMTFNAVYLMAGVWIVMVVKFGIWKTGFPISTISIVIALVFLYVVVTALSVMS